MSLRGIEHSILPGNNVVVAWQYGMLGAVMGGRGTDFQSWCGGIMVDRFIVCEEGCPPGKNVSFVYADPRFRR